MGIDASIPTLLLLLLLCTLASSQWVPPAKNCEYRKGQTECLSTQCMCIWCNFTDQCLTGDSWNSSKSCPSANSNNNCPHSTQAALTAIAWTMVIAAVLVLGAFPIACVVMFVVDWQKHTAQMNEQSPLLRHTDTGTHVYEATNTDV